MVESPHKTSFYARETDGYGADKNWQEAAQYWYFDTTVSLLSLYIPIYDQVQRQTHSATQDVPPRDGRSMSHCRKDGQRGNIQACSVLP